METHHQTSNKIRATLNRASRWPFIVLLRFYRFCISPLLGPRCRFEPTCSNYCEQALNHYGLVKGLWVSVKRISKCHPWHEGGYDPVTNNTDQTKND